MIQDYLDLFIERIKQDKRLRYLLLGLVSFIFVGWLGFNYFSKGTIEVSVAGESGATRIIVSKANLSGNEKPQEIIKIGSSAKVRVKSGNYKVAAEVEIQKDGSRKVLSSFKEVSVKARATSKVELTIDQAKLVSVQDLKDKPASLNLANNLLYSTTVYGVSNIHNLKDSTYTTIRKEPAYLRDVVGLCNFSNGRSVALNKLGSVFSIDGSQAKQIDYSDLYGEEAPELTPQSSAQNSSEFICQDDGVLLFGSLYVNQNMQANVAVSNPYSELGGSYARGRSDSSLWFFTAFSADSSDGEGNRPTSLSKKITKVHKDGSQESISLGSYVSGLSAYSDSGFCFYYQKDIRCGDILTGKTGDPFKLPDNKLVTNIEAIDSKRVAYSFGNRAWILNVDSGQSTQIYTSDHDIIKNTMSIDRSLGLLSFGTQKVSSTESSYKAPIIEYGKIGL